MNIGRNRGHRLARRPWRRVRRRLRFPLTAVSAVGAVTTVGEIVGDHYRATLGGMAAWTPLSVSPPLLAVGVAGLFSRQAAKTWLPVTAIAYALTELAKEYRAQARSITVS